MEFQLEHPNLCVRDIEPMIRFMKASSEFRVRGEGKRRDGTRWVHVVQVLVHAMLV